MMNVVEIEKQLRKMNNAERLTIIELAAKLMKTDFPEINERSRKLRQSAEIMRDEYLCEKELTVLSDLDGEDFFDA